MRGTEPHILQSGGGLSVICPIAVVFPVPPHPVCTLWLPRACPLSLRYSLLTCCYPLWLLRTATPSSSLTHSPCSYSHWHSWPGSCTQHSTAQAIGSDTRTGSSRLLGDEIGSGGRRHMAFS